ncbi:MAG: hypothetical protein SGI91_02620 [Alphaproteobacteria bacterium]|jgi:hypothetical protein|nr:hypothetical protein [Alphaproteobacteria bacterium]
MSRTGYLVVGALVFALAAAGVLLWSDIATEYFGPQTLESRLTKQMNDVASTGGFAASFAEQDASRWRLADGHRFERLTVASSNAVIGRLGSSVVLDVSPPSWESQGLSIELPAAFAQQSNGKRVEVGVIARAARANASGVLNAVFATRQAGNSGWRKFELGGEFQVHTIIFDMPEVPSGYTAQPIIVLQSDADGHGRSVEILGVYARRVPRS